MGTVDDYLAGLPPEQASAFAAVVAAVLAHVPDAEQGTSYGMAAYRYRGRPLLGLRAAARHLSVFPFSPPAVEAAGEHLAGRDVSKGTVRFTVAGPLPPAALTALVRARLAEIDEALDR